PCISKVVDKDVFSSTQGLKNDLKKSSSKREFHNFSRKAPSSVNEFKTPSYRSVPNIETDRNLENLDSQGPFLGDLENLKSVSRISFLDKVRKKWALHTGKFKSKLKKSSSILNYITSMRDAIVSRAKSSVRKNGYKVWDNFIVLIHFFNLLILPMTLAWTYEFYNKMWVSIFYVCDTALLVNFYLNLTRPFLDEFGGEVTDPRLIRKHYFLRNFGAYELLGSIPLDLICVFQYPHLDSYVFAKFQ
ncbi:hypothetical protein HMI56_004211, partial [Coelomomyces lativittatus]